MCFASSIVESHRKLFLQAAATAAGVEATASGGAAKTTDKRAAKMSRSKSRLQVEVCGDCGATDPAWASINRGILLCSDCCSVHRSLGRAISIVKSLRQGTWEPSVLNFVNSLNAHGANSVWEHHLLDVATSSGGGGKGAPRLPRKPLPKDPLHPTKSDFIKAKHVNLAYVLKPNLQDDETISGGSATTLDQELSKQLHASVRTSNLETSLRLLVQGADPNFFHEEKRSTPLHVAAKFGQASQIELLLVYGADINAIDGNGLTPLEVAKVNNHSIVGERLLDAMYDVTDRIIMFLGGKKPDHASGRHLIVPSENNNTEISEQLKIARGRLQLVPNKMFEELVMDLYDEVDRRENEAIWATSTLNADNAAVPFLPANPFLSATRNQGRQKLARFSRAEFAGLLTDVLIDARRRQNMANLRPLDAPNPPPPNGFGGFYNSVISSSYNNGSEHNPNVSDEEPIYDPVASDDDYAQVESPSLPIAQQPWKPPSTFEMESMRKQISKYESEINQLKTAVQKLSSENSELKMKFSHSSHAGGSIYDDTLRIDSGENTYEPLSLPEGIGVGSNSSSTSSSANNSNQSTIKRPASMYERRLATFGNKPGASGGPGGVGASAGAGGGHDNRTATSMYQMAGGGLSGAVEKPPNPFGEEVKLRTDIVTRRLKELIMAMQDAANKESLVPCAERIRLAVMNLIAVFTTPSNCSESIRETLKQLARFNILIQHQCENLHKAYDTEDKPGVDTYIKEVRDCAYYIASATKALVLQFD